MCTFSDLCCYYCAVTTRYRRYTTTANNRSQGLEDNVSVCIIYVESWLRGNGCIPVNHKMEDAATAEISRAQVRQALFIYLFYFSWTRIVYMSLYSTKNDRPLYSYKQ